MSKQTVKDAIVRGVTKLGLAPFLGANQEACMDAPAPSNATEVPRDKGDADCGTDPTVPVRGEPFPIASGACRLTQPPPGSCPALRADHTEALNEPEPAVESTGCPIGKDSALPRRDTLAAFRDLCWCAAPAFSSFFKASVPPLIGYAAPQKVLVLDEQAWDAAERWFFLGDVHGDFFALYNTVEHVKAICPDFRLVFLGDLVDRGPHPVECLWYLLTLSIEHPNRVLWLAGNHDVAISHAPDGQSFVSSVIPSEFADVLSTRDGLSLFRQRLGTKFVELVAGLPRAALFPDGLLATHGGFPHTDLVAAGTRQATVEEMRIWLNSEACLQDFTWTRITRYPRKIPNRTTTGCSYGFDDFRAFRDAVKDCFPVARLVTGHDHPEAGYDDHPSWADMPALSLAGFGFGMNYEEPSAFTSGYRDCLTIARGRRDRIPEVLKIDVDREDLGRFFDGEVARHFV